MIFPRWIALLIFFTVMALHGVGWARPMVGSSQARYIAALSGKDSVRVVRAGERYQRGVLHEWLWGRHYRQIWATPVPVPLLNLQEAYGGLRPLEQGGSFQTKNLRLVNPQGREYVLRSVDKNPTKALPKTLQKTFLARLMQDQTSVIHPYGALIVPPLADAAGVYHTNPRLIVVPDDPALGPFREEFKDMLAILEERPEGDQHDVVSFGFAPEVMSTRKAFKDLVSSSCSQVDRRRYLRARLFDMWLGDWSRREDQWRWGVYSDESRKTYRAIPRDRDHAFFKFNDGLITWLISLFKTNYQSFTPRIKHVRGLNKSARPQDVFLLGWLSEQDFREVADSLSASLTDEVIRQALARWPDTIQALSGKDFEKILQSRRADLPAVALKFYRILSREVLLPGTDQKERFLVDRLPNGDTRIRAFNADDKACAPFMFGQRVFSPKETKEVKLFGLGGKDTFVLSGKAPRGVQLILFDGEGEDQVRDSSRVAGWRRKTWIMEAEDGNSIEAGPKTRIKEHNHPLAEEFTGEGWLLRHRLH